MIVKLLTEHHLEFLSLKGGCRGSSESTHVKMSHCLKSHALALIIIIFNTLPSPLSTRATICQLLVEAVKLYAILVHVH